MTGGWMESGAFAVAAGVYRIPLPMRHPTLHAVNTYAVLAEDGITLIDGGHGVPEALDQLDRGLRLIGKCLADVVRVLVTHVHYDHYTLAPLIRTAVGAEVGLGARERTSLEWLCGSGGPRQHQADRLRTAGAHDLADYLSGREDWEGELVHAWEMPDVWLTTSVIRLGGRDLEILPTPGHTQGHTCFVLRDAGVVFTGDHLLPTITPAVGFEPVPVDGALADYLGSLRQIAGLGDLTMLPAHGPSGRSAATRADETLAHHERRLEEVRLVVEGRLTAKEVAERLFWTSSRRRFGELSQRDHVLALTETVAHLEVLATTGSVVREDVSPAWSFTPV